MTDPIIRSFTQNTETTRQVGLSALKALQSGKEWMYEFRLYRVSDVAFEAGALVIRGKMLKSLRGSPMLRDATFSDSDPA